MSYKTRIWQNIHMTAERYYKIRKRRLEQRHQKQNDQRSNFNGLN